MGNSSTKRKEHYSEHADIPIDPRNGSYSFGKVLVVREGELASIFQSDGRHNVVCGPAILRPYFSEVKFLERCTCDEQSYLIIEYLNGRKEHKRGPTFVFIDPCVHKSVTVQNAIPLETSQNLVVYSEITGKGVTRKIVGGPNIFIPESNEWLHQFSWHGTVLPGKAKGSITGHPNDTKTAHAVEFTKLRQMPDQMYYTVRDLRTSDDALLTLHIMIFFELLDIDRMLDATNDPISDMINAANADVMTYGACRTYETLLAESHGLSDNKSYPLLASRLETIGYTLKKVVYRGYKTSEQLQAMQETAISSRTKLRLEADTQRQEQANVTAALIAREGQAAHKFSQDQKEAEHKGLLKQMAKDQELASTKADLALTLQHEEDMKKSRNALTLQHEQEMNAVRKAFLQSLVEMEVDLTKYLCAEVGSKPTSHLLIENAGDSGSANSPNLHFDATWTNKRR